MLKLLFKSELVTFTLSATVPGAMQGACVQVAGYAGSMCAGSMCLGLCREHVCREHVDTLSLPTYITN